MRTPRCTNPGAVYHVISRFVDREWRITSDDERARYLDFLGRALQLTEWKCLAYALMSSHIHLLMIAGRDDPESVFKRTHPPFALWMNRRHERLGPLFAARPTMWCVRDSALGRVLAYIHNNPVRAGVVERADESSWTSHRAYVHNEGAPWLDCAEGRARTGISDATLFDAWVDGELRTPRMLFAERELTDIRRLAHRRGAIKIATIDAGISVPLVARSFAQVHEDPREVIAWVAAQRGVAPHLVRSKHRYPALVRARRLVLHVGRALGVQTSQMCDALAISAASGARLLVQAPDVDAQGIAAIASSYLQRNGTNVKASPFTSQ